MQIRRSSSSEQQIIIEGIIEHIEFHYTPYHRSWLNTEIGISVLETECLNRRIPDQDTLQKEVAARKNGQNNQKA